MAAPQGGAWGPSPGDLQSAPLGALMEPASGGWELRAGDQHACSEEGVCVHVSEYVCMCGMHECMYVVHVCTCVYVLCACA